MRTALIGGVGNVLLGDDAVGPYVLRLLESQYKFSEDVSLIDLGTPGLDLTHQIVGLRSLILIDSVTSDEPAGAVLLYRKDEILSVAPAERLDPHSPALSECLMTADLLGASPEHVLLVGIVGDTYEPGQPLSASVREAAQKAIEAILDELQVLEYSFQKKHTPQAPAIWWSSELDHAAVESAR